MLEPFQQRVVEEHAALTEKVDKLWEFIWEPTVELPDAECKRLDRQLDLMINYSNVLEERIEAFK